MSKDNTTHFGFEQVAENEKAKRVREVFSSVATKYDVMNDLMSGGLHRIWKGFTVELANVRPGERVLDVAGGTADLALAFAKRAGRQGLGRQVADAAQAGVDAVVVVHGTSLSFVRAARAPRGAARAARSRRG